MSITSDALEYMQKTGCTAYEAAQKFGLATSTVYAASRRPKCPHCGSYIKDSRPDRKERLREDNLLDI